MSLHKLKKKLDQLNHELKYSHWECPFCNRQDICGRLVWILVNEKWTILNLYIFEEIKQSDHCPDFQKMYNPSKRGWI